MTASRSLADLVETSPALAGPLRGAARAASTEAPILILGESGSGRTTLARALHAASRRAAGPLVEVDVGVVPGTLFESELFGHRPGAFTGAGAARAGRVERAEGGTLLLDHLVGLPQAVQPKLLRLLAERRYVPLGGGEQRADVRFIGIASEELPEMVARGAFRADLYYRLEVVTLRLPPLRERRADLPRLVDALLADLGERLRRPGLSLRPAARAWMLDYDWPGNLRQLRNVLERSAILASGEELDPPPPPDLTAVPAPLAEVERRQILRALAHTRGHQGRAARLLGISRKTLWQKRRRYGIP